MKTKIAFTFFFLVSAFAFCDSYFFVGGDLGYARRGSHNGFLLDLSLCAQHFFGVNGHFGIGFDLNAAFEPFKFITQKNHYEVNAIAGDFCAAPVFQFRIFTDEFATVGIRPVVFKFFPRIGFSIMSHPGDVAKNKIDDLSGLYAGCGFELCIDADISGYVRPPKGVELFFAFKYSHFVKSKANSFLVGLGARAFFGQAKAEREIIKKALKKKGEDAEDIPQKELKIFPYKKRH